MLEINPERPDEAVERVKHDYERTYGNEYERKIQLAYENEVLQNKIHFAQHFKVETRTKNGDTEFDPEIFTDSIEKLENRKNASNDNKEKAKIKEQIKLIKEVENQVSFHKNYDYVINKFEREKEDLVRANPFLNNAQELQNLKNPQHFQEKEAYKTGVIEHEAHIENITRDLKPLLSELQTIREQHDDLINSGRHHEAFAIWQSNYKDKVLQAYRLVGQKHNEVFHQKGNIGQEMKNLLNKYIDHGSLSNEEAQKLRRLEIENAALTQSIGEYAKLVENKLVKKHSLWAHVIREDEQNNTQESNPETNNEQEEISDEVIEGRKKVLKIISTLAGITLGSGMLILSGGASLPFITIVGASLIATGIPKNQEHFLAKISPLRWLGRIFSDLGLGINKLREELNNPSTTEERKTQLQSELIEREEKKKEIDDCMRYASMGAGGSLLLPTLSNILNSGGMLETIRAGGR